MAGLSLAVAAATADLQPVPDDWFCGRNFRWDGNDGVISQVGIAGGARYPIRFQIWNRSGFGMELTRIRTGSAPPGPPHSLTVPLRFTASRRQIPWLRFWADGIYAGQFILATPRMMRGMTGPPDHVFLTEPAILEALGRASVPEIEILLGDGTSLLRERIPAPSPAAIVAAFAEQSAWLAGAMETRRPPDCGPRVHDED